jgi:lipoprotein-anchoring transpeptidase ErfK/SrfK
MFRTVACSAGLAVAGAWLTASAEVEFRPPPWPERPAVVEEAGASAGVGEAVAPAAEPRGAATWLEVQVALAQRGFSSGSIDGMPGPQTRAALRAFQESEALGLTGEWDEATRARLTLVRIPLAEVTLRVEDLAGLAPLGATWLEKSQQPLLAHESLLERIAERFRAHPRLLQRLNPAFDWPRAAPGARLTVPNVEARRRLPSPAHLHIRLAERVLQARDARGAIVFHCPVSIARDVAKRPVGELRVTVVIPDPDYTFKPETFPESEEGRRLGRRLMIPPGPNNPVGVAWIGLDRPGYGLHGTPAPEQVGRTESHGCFRLANWDARTLLQLAWVGLPVRVEP